MTDTALRNLLQQIDQKLDALLTQKQPAQDYYSTADVARILGRSPFTVREWARLGRICAEKRMCGRGNAQEWIVSFDELERIKCEGLLPPDR